MPTSFTSPINGQTADASHVTQFVAPINNLESGAALYAESAGSATVYTATLAPVPALVAGLTIRLKIDETNSGAATLNVNGTGAVDIRYDNGSAYNTALPASFLKAGGVYQFTYQGTYWLVTGGAAAGSGGGSVATLDDVGDVDVTGAANGTVLMKTASGWEDRNLGIADINSLQTALDGKSATSHTHSLDNLSDVAITTPATRNVVYYNGSAFVNQNLEVNDIQSGNFATARLATGTASAGLIPISNGAGSAAWGSLSAGEIVDSGGYFDKATQTVAASTTADITWTDLLGPTAILTHSASSATIGVSATKNFDIDCSVLLGGANTAGLWGTAALVLLVDGTEVARDPQSFYDFNGSTTAKAGLVRTILWSGPVTTSIKLQLVTGATYGCDVVGTQSGSVRSCLRITQRGA